MSIICFDPGMNTGYAIFRDGETFPERTGVLRAGNKEKAWWDRQTHISDQLFDLLEDLPEVTGTITKAYIELPLMFETAKGMTCATGQDGQDSSLVKLAVVIGRLHETLRAFAIDVEYVRVNNWKGTLPKAVVDRRIAARLGCEVGKFGDHATDAVGIGLHVKGKFKANTGGKK